MKTPKGKNSSNSQSLIILNLLLFVVLLVGSVTSVLAATTGVWEGVIQDAARPLVINVDLDRLVLKLDAAGSATWKLENLVSDEHTIKFDAEVTGNPLHFEGSIAGNKVTGQVKTPSQRLAFWLERLPLLPVPKDRVEAWNQDLDVLIYRFLRYDRSYSDKARRRVRERVRRLRTKLASLTDQEVMVEIARIVALSGNAHTRLYIVRNRTEVRRLPVRVWWFGSELRIVRAMPEYRELLGCRLTKIGDISVYDAARRVADIKAGNKSWRRYMSTYLLTSSDVLFGAHISQSADETYFTARCSDGEKRIRLVPSPLKKDNNALEAWWDLTPESREQNALLMPVLDSAKTPLYLQRTKENYWFQRLPGSNIIYFQYNRSQQAVDELTMSQFGDRLIGELKTNKPAALVVDLRFNTGGDLTVAKPFIRNLANAISDTPVYVITGRATFSAGISALVELREWAHATIVGEPAGDGLEMWSEGGNLLMPNSKLTLHYGNAFHSYSKREYPARKPYVEDMSVDSIAPDLFVEISWSDYISGRDPAFEAIVRRLVRR